MVLRLWLRVGGLGGLRVVLVVVERRGSRRVDRRLAVMVSVVLLRHLRVRRRDVEVLKGRSEVVGWRLVARLKRDVVGDRSERVT